MITLEDALRIGKSTAGLWGTSDCMTYVEFTFSASELLAFARQVEAETIAKCADVADELDPTEVIGPAIRALSSPIEQGRKPIVDPERFIREAADKAAVWSGDCRNIQVLPMSALDTILITLTAMQRHSKPYEDCAACHEVATPGTEKKGDSKA